MQRNTSFINLLTSRVIYAHGFRDENHASFLNAQINDNVDDMISPDLLSSDSRSTDAHHIGRITVVSRQSTDFLLVKELRKKGAGTRVQGVTHMNDMTIYSSKETDVKLMLQASDVFVKNPARPSPSYSLSFYWRKHLLFQYLRQAQHLHLTWSGFPFSELLGI